MTDAIAHRGPDGEGFHFAPGCGLGHRRLAIIDVERGQQPLANEDGSVVVVFNGEIYNFEELRNELRRCGHAFKTRSDTEVIVHGWEEWGSECLKRFRGMFAFALYDRNRDLIFLARDRLGKKPLYYGFFGGDRLVFSSELKALLVHPLMRKDLDPEAVDDYFAFGYVPDPETIYKSVRKLPPAHYLEIERGKPPEAPTEYWRLVFDPAPVGEDEAAHELIARMDESVRLRLISDVPLGAFLSGGVDSSGIVASMARQTGSPVKTFAIGFGGDGPDELAHAARVAHLYRTSHHDRPVNANPLAAYRTQAKIFDEPFADSSSVPTHQLCKLAREMVTVALSGDGGDELFAGYRRYRWFMNAERLRRHVPQVLRGPAFGLLGNMYPKLDWAPRWLRAKHTLQEIASDSASGYFRTVCRVQNDARRTLYSPSMRRRLGRRPSDRIAALMREADGRDSIAGALYADIKTYLPGDILAKVDRTSMAASLEVRVPLLDHTLVEWTAKLPSALKLRGGEGKYLLKRALEPYVPRENLYRQKEGFAAPLAAEFRRADRTFIRDTLLGSAMGDSGLFDMDAIDRVAARHAAGAVDHSILLWSLLMFDGFLKEVHYASATERTLEGQRSAIRPL
jgi:asparagine synthase (glutamine-hydrolysing)